MDSGRLEDEPMPVVCRRLADESRTGCLRLLPDSARQEHEVRIFLREGKVYTASAPAGRARLGDRLVGGGYLTPEDLEKALQAQRAQDSSVRLGDVVVSEGMVSREVLRHMIRDQICDSVAVGLGRTSGEWQFVDGESVSEDVPLGLGMQDTLMEASRRLGQLETIRQRLGSLDAVVDFGSGKKELRLALKADEWAMLTHIDGKSSVAEIAARSGYSQLETARIIYGLLSAGVVNVVGEDDSSESQQATDTPSRQSSHGQLIGELQDLPGADDPPTSP